MSQLNERLEDLTVVHAGPFQLHSTASSPSQLSFEVPVFEVVSIATGAQEMSDVQQTKPEILGGEESQSQIVVLR